MQIRIFFFSLFCSSFSIHSYTYVVPISAVPKYSGGLIWREKKFLESFKSTPFDCVQYMCHQMRGSVCIGPLVSCVSVGVVVGWRQRKQQVSALLYQMVRSVVMIIFVVLLFGL